MTPDQVNRWIDEHKLPNARRKLIFDPPTKPYRVDFKFDGKRMLRAGSSANTPK
jgi:uncharacterized protein YbaA (DUF1428 family)